MFSALPVNGKMIDAFYAYVVDYRMRRDNANSELIVTLSFLFGETAAHGDFLISMRRV